MSLILRFDTPYFQSFKNKCLSLIFLLPTVHLNRTNRPHHPIWFYQQSLVLWLLLLLAHEQIPTRSPEKLCLFHQQQHLPTCQSTQKHDIHAYKHVQIKRVIARPFCGSHEKMLNYFGKGFELNVPAALEWLDKETNSREKEVLMYQIKKFQKI